MARKSRKHARWTEEIARNVVADYAGGISTEDIAQIYRVPEKAVIHYLSHYGLLFQNIDGHQNDDRMVHANILQKMAEGINPSTGMPLPQEILDSPEILRALCAGAAALMTKTVKAEKMAEKEMLYRSEEERKAAMQSIRLRPGKEKSSWTQEDLCKLSDMSISGMDVLSIAAYFGKTVEETERAMARLR